VSMTSLDLPLVREYLQQLDALLEGLPDEKATELREQISSHLDEALDPDAGRDHVAEVLKRLGRPSDLVADVQHGGRNGPTRTRRVWKRLRRVRWYTWAVVALISAVAIAGIAYTDALVTSPSLQGPGLTGWVFAQDGDHQVMSQADGLSQVTVPIRVNEMQGYFFSISNPSRWTQTIVGLPNDFVGLSGSPNGTHLGVAVVHGVDLIVPPHGYVLPASIPPGGQAIVRVLWLSRLCLSPGATEGMDALPLRVRVGWRVRSEMVPLGQEFALAGHGRDEDCADGA
jgi:predicted DNA-binding protein